MKSLLSDIQTNREDVQNKLYSLIEKLYPICRSITGDGVRETLQIIGEIIPLNVIEVQTGLQVFDWEIPREWNIKDAYILDEEGNKIVDFKESNLHVLNYSAPINKTVDLNELKEHLFSIPEQPDVIPYRTSYFKENWGFCIQHSKLIELKEGKYRVVVDSSLENGSLTYGEYFIQGQTDEEILISTHICHPSLCNDNLSGISISSYLASFIRHINTRYSYRFVFLPATIGAITWLKNNENSVYKIKHGLVAALLGDSGGFNYKKSRQDSADIDKAVTYCLEKNHKGKYAIHDFSPYGYDERQYCSPGFNLPVGCLMRSVFGTFPEYHTSADNLQFVKKEKLWESLQTFLEVFNVLEYNYKYINLNPKCEPLLGKRGLYDSTGGASHSKDMQMAILWVLNYSDGEHDLLEIAQKSNIAFEIINEAAEKLLKFDLLEK